MKDKILIVKDNAYLSKPANTHQLRDAVSGLLKHRKENSNG